MSKLATLGSAELKKLSERDFLSGLQDMSPAAIDRFRRMRKLSTIHNTALDTFLRQNPDKRLTASSAQGKSAPPVKAKTKKKPVKPKKAPRPSPLKVDKDGYVPLWIRMRAWWDGVDPEDLMSGPPASKVRPRMSIDTSTETPEEALRTNRLAIVQQLWGDGLCLPGGEKFSLSLLEEARTKSSVTIADIIAGKSNGKKASGKANDLTIADLTAGLGGGTRHIAEKLGATVLGFERDKDFAEAAQRLSEETGNKSVESISWFDPEQVEKHLDKAQCDIILARELLFSLPDSKGVLSQIGEALAPDGTLIFTDFALADRSSENKSVLAWRQTEPRKPTPSSVDEYRELLQGLRYDVKSIDDISKEYASAIQVGWKSMVEHLKSGSFSRAYVDALIQEGQIWLSRSRALKSGQLRLIKCRAVMKKGPKRALSDSMAID